MNTKMQFLLFIMAVIFLQIGCGTSAVNSQTKVIENGEVIAERFHPKDEARIEDEFERLNWDGNNKDALMKQPAPKFVMVFECEETEQADCINGERRQELPENAQKLVDKRWNTMLDHGYILSTSRVTFIDPKTYSQLDETRSLTIINFSYHLQKLSFTAPNGERKFSNEEAGQIMDILRKHSCETIQQSDVCKYFNWKTKEWHVVDK